MSKKRLVFVAPASTISTPASRYYSTAFTIVELLVVIVIIGILAAITIVSYTGISQRAVAASMQSDLDNASKKLKMFDVTNSAYPLTIDCSSAESSINTCIKASGGNSFTYQATGTTNPQSYELYSTNGSNVYVASDSSSPTKTNLTVPCPTGFIPVPGSSTYGTSDFCVMKYEAKIQGNDNGNQTYSSTFVPESRPTGTPWVNISQTNSITESSSLGSGYHLITEAEWMTIAQNVLSVPSNWSGGAVGSGYIYSGHNDGNVLIADSDDNNGYSGDTNQGGDEKRTLTLTNGQVIWDLAGNVFEWTQGTSTNNQPGVTGSGYAYRQWTTVTAVGGLAVNVFPSGTGLAGASSWDSSKGIGKIYSSADDTTLRSFIRGGSYNNGGSGGVLYLVINNSPSTTGATTGFRVSR
jgi:prepilin-type N-terminal cleavage/methylation domain-containing protein